MIDDLAVESLVQAIKQEPKEKNKQYHAVVSRIDNEGVAWVNLAGSTNETPTASTSTEVEKGDSVIVEWRNNKLYIAGNYSNPSAGTARVRDVENAAQIANEAAHSAVADAGVAREAAESAVADAEIAKDASDVALKGLGKLEDVVGVLDWITTHSKVTDDTMPTVGKSYYIKRPDGTFVLVTDVEEKNPHEEGWYELDEAIQNYIMSHLALTDDGLYVMKDGTKWKVLITNGGVYILDENDNKVAQYEDVVVVGREDGNNVLIDPNGMKIRDGLTEIATFLDNEIELGKNSQDSLIRFCGGMGQIRWNTEDNDARLMFFNAYEGSENSTIEFYNSDSSLVVGADGMTIKAPSSPKLYVVKDTAAGTYFAFSRLDNGSFEALLDGAEMFGYSANGSFFPHGFQEGAGTKMDDYVIQNGTSGNWSYRRWDSGKTEAWCTYTGSSASAANWVSPLKYRDIDINIPNGIFYSAPRVYATSYNNQAWVVSAHTTSETALSVRIATVASGAITPSLRLYCVQG